MSLLDRILAFGHALTGTTEQRFDPNGQPYYHVTPQAPRGTIPSLPLQENGLRAQANDPNAVDALMVLYVTQMVNKIAEDSQNVAFDFTQTHQLRYRGRLNEVTADTIIAHCVEAGWDEQHTGITQFELMFELVIQGPRIVNAIEMDPASMMIAMQMHSQNGQLYFNDEGQGTPTPLLGINSSFN